MRSFARSCAPEPTSSCIAATSRRASRSANIQRSLMPSSRARSRGRRTACSTSSAAPCAPPRCRWPMAAAELGEFERIRRFFAPLAGPGGLGLHDDAALVDCAPGQRLVVTADAIVAGVHYLPEDPPELVARKLLRVNLSDLAAMGARPLHYLLTTALPAQLGPEWLARFAEGLAEDQRRYGIDLLGGDSVAVSGPAVLSLIAIGEIATGQEVRRSGAKPGDVIWVSGTIGDALFGLNL